MSKPRRIPVVRVLVAVLMATMVLAVLAAPAQATPVTVGGGWQCLAFGTTGSFATGASVCDEPDPGAPPWTFAGGAVLKVVDCCLHGDEFEVFDNGVSIGTTSPAAPDGTCGTAPDPCWADPLASKGTFVLGRGRHSITIQVIDSPFGSGNAWFRVDPRSGGR